CEPRALADDTAGARLRAEARAEPDAARARGAADRAGRRLGAGTRRTRARGRGPGVRSRSIPLRTVSAPSLGAGLAGRGVLVTGATGGIGSAVARAFAECGSRVAATDVSAGGVRELAGSLPGEGHVGIGADLGDVDAHDRLVASAADAVGPLV